MCDPGPSPCSTVFCKALSGFFVVVVFFKFEFVFSDHSVISISSAALSRGAKWSVFAVSEGCGFVALAGRGPAWKTGAPLFDGDGCAL